MSMLGSYLLTGLRQLFAHKLYSAINIVGLAVGLACAILIFLFVRHELGFDQGFPDAERTYRISADVVPGSQFATYPAANVWPAAAALLADFPDEIEQAGRIFSLFQQPVRLRRGADTSYEDGLRWADPSFFDIFKLDWLAGDPQRALAEPATVVLTASAAAKYFGAENPLGGTLLLEDQWPLTVTGVIRDLPRDTHLTATAIAAMDTVANVLGYPYTETEDWSFTVFHTYVRLKPGARIETVESRLADFVARHKRPSDRLTGMTATRLKDIHLNGRALELAPPGSPANVWAFGAVAICILVVACINFTNLATARGVQRAREVGVRKSLGAARRQLVGQFLGEAIAYAAIAMLLAAALVELLLPPFNAFAGTALTFDYFGDGGIAAGLVAFAAVVGLLAGAYPALYLSAFEPAKVLKGDATRGAAGVRLRAALVATQFAVSIALLIVTAVIYLQTEFARNVDRGFETEQVVILSGSETAGVGGSFEAFRQRLLEHPEITHVIFGSMQPHDAGIWTARVEGGDPDGQRRLMKGVDYDFFATYGIDVVAGRAFSEDFATDREVPFNSGCGPQAPPTCRSTGPHGSTAFVLNELAAREFGWTPAEAVGKWYEMEYARDFSLSIRGPIVGVVRDTYFESVREPLRPLVFFLASDASRTTYFDDASVRVTGRRLPETLAFIDAAWKELNPDLPLVRSFLDDTFAALYQNEERQAQIFGAFALLAIFVACLGLFGLAAFTTERRTKEIGIRKTLGGSVWDVVALLTTDFSKLVLLANVVAWPIAFVLMQRWLADFAYRISLSPTVFIASALVAFLVAWVTIASIGLRAASVKPMHSLRHE
jgi:putative ABC transport system permease protein